MWSRVVVLRVNRVVVHGAISREEAGSEPLAAAMRGAAHAR